MTRVSIPSAESAGSVWPIPRPRAHPPAERDGPIERFMGALIRRLAWSRLSDPRVAIALSGTGLLLGMLVAATAPNAETLPLRLPLSVLPSLNHTVLIPTVLLYSAYVLACLGLAGMLWAHSQGWRPDPRHLVMAATAIVAVTVSLTPIGSSDTASYAAYGREAALGLNPYAPGGPLYYLYNNPGYVHAIGSLWRTTPSVYGPFATAIQAFAASIGGKSVVTTVWVLMILNAAVFLGTGWFLLKTSDDPVRATLFWTANPVLIQQLVAGGHLDTIVAAAAICSIQVARRVTNAVGDVVVGILIGLACGIKIYAVLIGVGLAWAMLRRREWARITRIAAVALATLGLSYSFYGLVALKPLFSGLQLITGSSPWRVFKICGESLGLSAATIGTIINCLWPILLLALAWVIHQRIAADQPREVVAPFALTFAWIVVAPWAFAWYTAVAWAALTQVPRNRMTRWLTIVTVVLALSLSSGGQAALGGRL